VIDLTNRTRSALALAVTALAIGVGCVFHVEDAIHMRCQTTADCKFSALICSGATATCELPSPVGGACASPADCEGALLCEHIASSGTCVSAFGLNEGPCDLDSCGDGLTCGTTTKGDVCMLAEGQRCFTSDSCVPPTVCAAEEVYTAPVCLSPALAGATCGEDAACADGPCEGGRCHIREGDVCEGAEEYCSTETVCRPDSVGTARCLEPGTLFDTCADDKDCGSQTECEGGYCLGSYAAECSGDAGCAAPWVCRPNDIGTNVCSAEGGPGEACDTKGDCAEGDCSLATAKCPGRGGASCSTEADCLDGLRCAVGTGEGRRCQSEVDGCGECDSTDDCANGAACAGGLCEQSIGGTCTTNACCAGDATCRSVDGVDARTCELQSDTPGDYCTDDSACASWLTCYNNECLVPEGGDCASAGECAGSSLVCMLRECVTRGSVGEVCVDAEGNGPEDASCQAGLLCGASSTCITPLSLSEGEACNRSQECKSSLSCNANVCSY
jgi:hypothetical protein